MPEALPPRKQYIIIDNNSFSSEAVALALRLAHFADKTHHANIKLLFTRSLKAEIDHGRGNYARMQKYAELQSGKINKKPATFSLREAIAGYDHYIETAQETVIDKQLKEAMVSYLCSMFERDKERFYRIFDDKRISVVWPESDIPALLTNNHLFSIAYGACSKSPHFKKILEEIGLHQDLADQSLIKWYETHLVKEPDAEVILVSIDKKFLQKMESQYSAHTGDSSFQKFKHFDLQGFAEHIQQNMETWIADTNQVNTEGLENAVSDVDRCYDAIMKKKRHAVKNGHNLSSPDRY